MQDGLGIQGWSCILAWELKHAKSFDKCDLGDFYVWHFITLIIRVARNIYVTLWELTRSTISFWRSNVPIRASASGNMTDDLAIGTRSARASDRTWVDTISILACRIVWAVVVIGAPGWQRCLCHYSSYVKDVISSLELVYVMYEQAWESRHEG